jgi:UDP-N-acetylglucosamine:LPS N-acetylglucosamine transferase
MMPKHQEHQTNAPGVVARNAGVSVPRSKRTSESIAAVIREVAENETMREAARAFAVSLDPWRKADPTRVIAERALALIR